MDSGWNFITQIKPYEFPTLPEPVFIFTILRKPSPSVIHISLTEIAELMIDYGIDLHTTLLRMIESDNRADVIFICKHKDMFQVIQFHKKLEKKMIY